VFSFYAKVNDDLTTHPTHKKQFNMDPQHSKITEAWLASITDVSASFFCISQRGKDLMLVET
jgi:hypothetical protein